MPNNVMCIDCNYCPAADTGPVSYCLKHGGICYLRHSVSCDLYNHEIKKSTAKFYVIEALQFTKNNFLECVDFIGRNRCREGTCELDNMIKFKGFGGDYIVLIGDFILKNSQEDNKWVHNEGYFKTHYKPL